MNHNGQIQDIIALCIQLTEAKKGYFFCQYSGHVNWLDVYAYSEQTVTKESKTMAGFGHQESVIRLNEPEANEQLEALIKKLEVML